VGRSKADDKLRDVIEMKILGRMSEGEILMEATENVIEELPDCVKAASEIQKGISQEELVSAAMEVSKMIEEKLNEGE